VAIVLTKASLLLAAQAWGQAEADQVDGPAYHVTVGLFTAGPLPITPSSVLADFTAATFPGYAVVTTTTWSDAYLSQAGRAQITSMIISFTGGAVVSGETILGWYAYREDTPDELAFADYFDDPVFINEPGDGVTFIINLNLAGDDHGAASLLP